jgi:hypothetical protein
MSAGGVFKLIANDGKADRMIMATKLLNQRIKDVMCARSRGGKDDITPTLVDLERTHILYVNAHFKPFAAIGYEYNKVRPNTGNATLGAGVTFSIPQFGDFFHDMVCRTRIGHFMANEGDLPTLGTTSFPFNSSVAVGPITIATSYNIVDARGQVIVAGGTVAGAPYKYRNFVHYCEYPGNRLYSNVKFDVNGNPLDEYNELVPVMLEKFCIAPNKRTGHDRLVGQEVPLTGYGGLLCADVSDADAANTPLGITRDAAEQSNQSVALFAQAPAPFNPPPGPAPGLTPLSQIVVAPLNSGANQVDVSRKLLQIVNGPQTPKPVQPALEIWNKLRFWFNDDVRLSVASVSIPFGQRYITIDLNRASALVFEYPSVYLEKIVDNGTSRVKSYTPIFKKNGIADPVIERMELYINNIFVNPEVHDIYIKRIGFSLIRVYRQQTTRITQDAHGETLLSQLKWPIEYMFVGLRPSWNIKDNNRNQWRDWHRMTRQVDATSDELTHMEVASSQAAAAVTYDCKNVIPDQYYLPVPTVNSMSLTSHGIVIFDGFSDTFFNQYMPFHYGGPALVTPDDPGAIFINLSLFPRSYQPAGHLNISRARETYLKWTTSYVSGNATADLLVVAVAINFLLITDGSAVLRYST